MNAQARDRLREMIANNGTAALDTPRVLAFQIGQALGDLPEEREALLAALNQGFVKRLRGGGRIPLDALADEMGQKSKITPEQARWALDSWLEVVNGVRSKTLDKADDFSPWAKTKGLSYRPPTAEQFARSGLIAGIIAGLLVGLFWGGVKALSLAKPIHHVSAYDYGYSGDHDDDFEYSSRRSSYAHVRSRRAMDYEFTSKSLIAWAGWIVAGGLIGCVIGGTSAVYLSGGNMRFVGGYSGAAVGAMAGLANGHRLFTIGGGPSGSLSDAVAQAIAGILAGALAGVILGGCRDLIVNHRSGMASNFFRMVLRLES